MDDDMYEVDRDQEAQERFLVWISHLQCCIEVIFYYNTNIVFQKNTNTIFFKYIFKYHIYHLYIYISYFYRIYLNIRKMIL